MPLALAKAVLKHESCPPGSPWPCTELTAIGHRHRSAITSPYRSASSAISDVCLRLSPGPLQDKLPRHRAAPFLWDPAPQEPPSLCPKALPSPFPAGRGPPGAPGAAGPAGGGPAAPPLAPRSLLPMGEPLTRRVRALPPMGGVVFGFAGSGSRTLSGGGRSVPEGAAGAAGGGDRDSDSLVRGPAAVAASLSPVLVCPRVSAAAVTVRRRLRRGRAVRGRRALRGGEEGAARRGWVADTGAGSLSLEGSGGGRVCLQNVSRCAEKPSARRVPAVRGCGGLGVTGAAGAGRGAAGAGGAELRVQGAASPASGDAVPIPCPPGCSSCRRRRKRPLGVGISIAPKRCVCRRCPCRPSASPAPSASPRGDLRTVLGEMRALEGPSHRPQRT